MLNQVKGSAPGCQKESRRDDWRLGSRNEDCRSGGLPPFQGTMCRRGFFQGELGSAFNRKDPHAQSPPCTFICYSPRRLLASR